MEKSPILHHAVFDASVEADTELICRVQRRDRAALEILFDRYAGNAVGLAFYILKDRALAEEVTIQAFWQVWCNAREFHSAHEPFLDWFGGIVHQLSIQVLTLAKTPCFPETLTPGHFRPHSDTESYGAEARA